MGYITRPSRDKASTDVGVDCFDFRRVILVEVRARLAENARAQGGAP